jgi:hypothetical protein
MVICKFISAIGLLVFLQQYQLLPPSRALPYFQSPFPAAGIGAAANKKYPYHLITPATASTQRDNRYTILRVSNGFNWL